VGKIRKSKDLSSVNRRYDSELARSRDLDGKAHNSVGYISVIVGLLLGSGSVLAGGETLRNTLASLFSEKPILALLLVE
jgi:hypothetical protein